MDLLCFCSVLCLLCLCACLLICALWSPAGKGLTSWLYVVSNCEFVTFQLVSSVRCGTPLYRFLIFAPLLTLLKKAKNVLGSKIIIIFIFFCVFKSLQCIYFKETTIQRNMVVIYILRCLFSKYKCYGSIILKRDILVIALFAIFLSNCE